MKNYIARVSPPKISSYLSKIVGIITRGFLAIWAKPVKTRLIIAAVLLIVVIGGIFLVKGRHSQQGSSAAATFVAKGKTAGLDKKFNVAIKDQEGKSTGADLNVTTTSVERTNEVIYNGRPLTARAGKDFLVINLEVENSTNNRLTVRPVDFYRLAGIDGKTHAADLQTEPVTVEPISSKNARTIFIIDESQKSFKIMIGDVRSSQETVEVSI